MNTNKRKDGVIGPIAREVAENINWEITLPYPTHAYVFMLTLENDKYRVHAAAVNADRAQTAERNDQYVIGLHHDAFMLCKFYIANNHPVPVYLRENISTAQFEYLFAKHGTMKCQGKTWADLVQD